MINTETKAAVAVELELPPNGGNLFVVSTLEEDAHYLRVTLDKSENFKVVAGEKLRDMLVNKFNNNRNALRDWYEETVVEGKAHRAWRTVEEYLGTVLKHGADKAASLFAAREEAKRAKAREADAKRRKETTVSLTGAENANKINASVQQKHHGKSEYERRKEWLADMNVLWFKGESEWQNRWLQDRKLSRRSI